MGGLTGEYESQERDQQTISQIQHTPSQTAHAQLGNPQDKRVKEDITGAHTSRQERPPLPVVVLAAEEHVDEQHRHRGAGDDHESVAEEEEAEHVVDPVEPDGVHDEVEFDEDSAKG